jgi:SAM-dependent methyltransferase
VKADYQRETFELEESHWWYRARRKILVECVARTLGDRNEARVLDVGCGGGTILANLAGRYQAYGIDLEPEAAEYAAARTGQRVMAGNFPEDVPEELHGLDGICLFDVIEHIEDDVEFLRSAKGLLRSGGFVFVSVPAIAWLFGQHDRINEHKRRYGKRDLLGALEAAGYELEEWSYFNFLLSPLLIPAILWKGRKPSGHNFEVRTSFDSLFESVMASEAIWLRRHRFPFGLSLLAVGRKG